MAPRRLLDPEIDSEDETTAKVTDYDLNAEFDNDIDPVSALSDIRKKNVKLLHDVDPKYRGKLSSRKDFEIDSNEIEEDELESNDAEDPLENNSENDVQSSENDEAAIADFSNKLKAPFSAIEDELKEDNSDLDEGSENDDFDDSDDDNGEEEQQSDEDSQTENSDEDESDFDGIKYIFFSDI